MIALPDVSRETYPATIGFTVAKQEIIDTEARLLRLVANAETRLRIAATNAIIAARDAPGTLAELSVLLEQGRIEEAIEAAGLAGAIRIADAYAAVYTLSGQKSAKYLEDVLEVVIGFDRVHWRAVNHMQGERLRFIREFTDGQRDATRLAMVDGIERGLNPVAQARNFRASVGLTARQQQAVINYRRLLGRVGEGDSEALTRQLRDRRFDRTVRRAIVGREPLSQAQIDRMVERYRERYIKYRAEVIGRTEALRAVHAANDEGYRQAIDGGVINLEELQRTWVTARDERVRPTHRDAAGQVRGIDEPFIIGGAQLRYPGDSRAPARETVQCRCSLATRLVTRDAA